MLLRTLFVVDSFIAATFAVGLLIAPGFVTGIFGAPLDPVGTLLGRLLGAFLLGDALILWQAREMTGEPAGLLITRSHGTVDALGVAICAVATVKGLLNPAG